MAQRPKRRRRRSGAESARPKRGLMIGMRSGFKKAAGAVAGEQKAASKPRSWLSTAFTVLLLAAAVAFLFYRWR